MNHVMSQVENVVFLMLENRSFDNLLGWLYQNQKPQHFFPASSSGTPYDGLIPGHFSNPYKTLFEGVKHYPVVPVPSWVSSGDSDRVPAYDPTEEFRNSDWNGVMNQLFGDEKRITGLPATGTHARMLGFYQDYYAHYMADWEGKDILWTFTPQRMSVLNGLARNFAVSDRWFSSVPSQTNPNRAYSLCGTSLGRVSNKNALGVETFDAPTVFNALGAAGKTWGLYTTSTWMGGKSYTAYTFPHLEHAANGQQGSIDDFKAQAKAGTLPAFSYLEPTWGGGKGIAYKQGTDYHPPSHLDPGEAFVKEIYHALLGSPQWAKTLFVITFDEHGGTYDHAAPPWGAINPDGIKGESGFDFNLFGVRVPTLLVSPFVQAGTVFRAPAESAFPFDHTSFIKTLLLWAGVDPASAGLGKRVPAAPSFDAVLQPTAVNATGRELPLPETPQLAAEEVSHLLEGLPFAVARRIIDDHEDLDAIERAVAEYKADPCAFEARFGHPG